MSRLAAPARPHPARRRIGPLLIAVVLMAGVLAIIASGCSAFDLQTGEKPAADSATGAGDAGSDDAAPTDPETPDSRVADAGADRAIPVRLPSGPGGGTLVGRLVDAATGLPIRDAGISLLAQDRRTISGPDGRFRLDGVEAGPVTIIFGPAEDHVTRSVDTRMPDDGLDLGVTPLLPAGPPTMIVPEYGGAVEGCEGTRVRFATDALAEPTAIRVTCLHHEREFPAPAPAGRLPLAAVDLAPTGLRPGGAAHLQVTLPAQPRYAPGVPLDLLRLDLDRLIWVPDSTIDVDEGGQTATGTVSAFGTYLVTAPPFGTFAKGAGDEPVVHQFRLSAEPDGPPSDVFPTGTVVVYASVDYTLPDGATLAVRTFDSEGELAFESSRRYSDSGRDNVPMVHQRGSWPAGGYVTTLYIGEPSLPVHSISWRVAVAPTGEPPPTLPPIATLAVAAGAPYGEDADPAPSAGSGPSAGCRPPYSWYAYTVQPGDTLIGLALRTGVDARTLMTANCMTSTTLYAGTTIYVPRPPTGRPAPPPAPVVPTAPVWTPPWPQYPTSTLVPPSAMPTTWYTPPAATAPPSWPSETPIGTSAAPPGPTHAPPGPSVPPAGPTVAPDEPTLPPPAPTQPPPEPTNQPAVPTEPQAEPPAVPTAVPAVPTAEPAVPTEPPPPTSALPGSDPDLHP